MIAFSKSQSVLKQRIKDVEGIILMLDFDGTLAPIVNTPNKVKLPPKIKLLLAQCLKFFPVAIISGRTVTDVRNNVGLDRLIYAGNHGLEWEINGQSDSVKIPTRAAKSLKSIKIKLSKLLPEYPGMLLEDKGLTLAVHYRMMKKPQLKDFSEVVIKTIQPYLQKGLSIIEGDKTIDIRPTPKWTKGHFALHLRDILQKKYGKKFLPVYIGDEMTDEDAFKKLRKAITIKIGKNNKSTAHYYLNNQKQIGGFLEWFLKIIKE